ncbi:glutamate-1-semialdehyde 2,1-aminomutase [Flavobacteriaceae bacterium]|uniref:glutamate-1-semialdehyde 2,1-aminomutase n=1 Tax=Candidatus Arcticimaribacter forsetii TaxID=2820661 RepID=UPI00207799B0|nr:glutamate-1-semialdehyde 2,1-aminomutase [Candidatus Arcticimaribacter forsetii]MDA8698868.1 glutamate-1-semialdehyde 2,1-aminomutase [Flavobacteriaceae bacterium]MDB2325837.1 glutamate-1-semialdehyde 2,1-aminomutase [Flavobacteriaceae bacterium]MDB2329663.1 glutamate-1-semialdehyde 2,1-aminomutase [Flavobacteriaceae bacterium]MDB2345816.1 glutamate-1-semialdehyde 2,1-aminomutase [Flavobacteriaceae bacterium]MDB4674927.1 glutamate-1-semialdehyde 2,1-aminomutase [Flavobacteriaceae bacterium]
MQYQRSSSLFKEAQEVIPGGVNSPVRAFKAVGGTPIFVDNAQGAYLYDVDGNRLIDYISSWGPMILGHVYEPVIEALTARAKKGTSFGMPTELETEIAKLAIEMIPNMDKIRFVNSGTEACMSAVRLARGYTSREKIIKFAGCYHGHSDSFLIQAGSGAITFGAPNSPGVTQGTAKDTLLAQYNDIESVERVFEQYPNEVAAIIIEPVAGNMGCIPPNKGFLEGLRSLCDRYGALLIFDEVMTGFRLAPGGAQERLNIRADIATYGKVIGGGLPVGAFTASNEIMNHLAPDGPVYQAGTLSGNPLAMAAGLAMLNALNQQPEMYDRLDKKTERLHLGMEERISVTGLPYQINRFGSMVSLHFTNTPVIDFTTAAEGNNDYFKKYFHGMLKEGVYLPPSAFESYFLNDALTNEDIDFTLYAFERVIKGL